MNYLPMRVALPILRRRHSFSWAAVALKTEKKKVRRNKKGDDVRCNSRLPLLKTGLPISFFPKISSALQQAITMVSYDIENLSNKKKKRSERRKRQNLHFFFFFLSSTRFDLLRFQRKKWLFTLMGE